MAASGTYQDDDSGGAITDINVTPFVDVVLVLLIIFMVTAPLIRGVDIHRPEATVGGEVKSTLVISVDKESHLDVNGVGYEDDAQAIAQIQEIARSMSEPKAIIRGDARSAYGGVMRAIDLAKRAGVDAIALENVAPTP